MNVKPDLKSVVNGNKHCALEVESWGLCAVAIRGKQKVQVIFLNGLSLNYLSIVSLRDWGLWVAVAVYAWPGSHVLGTATLLCVVSV